MEAKCFQHMCLKLNLSWFILNLRHHVYQMYLYSFVSSTQNESTFEAAPSKEPGFPSEVATGVLSAKPLCQHDETCPIAVTSVMFLSFLLRIYELPGPPFFRSPVYYLVPLLLGSLNCAVKAYMGRQHILLFIQVSRERDWTAATIDIGMDLGDLFHYTQPAMHLKLQESIVIFPNN